MGDVNGGGYTCTREEIYGKFLYLPFHLTVSLKLLFFFFKHLYNPLWSEQWIWDHFSPVQDPSLKSESEVAQSCLTLSDPMDCSLQGSSIHGIFQARVLEWIAISFSRESSRLRDWTWVSCMQTGAFTIWATFRLFSVLLLARILSSDFCICPQGISASWGFCFGLRFEFQQTLNIYIYIYIYIYTHTHTHVF